jgi:hypothetical protein
MAHTREVSVHATYLTGPLSDLKEETVDVVSRRHGC